MVNSWETCVQKKSKPHCSHVNSWLFTGSNYLHVISTWSSLEICHQFCIFFPDSLVKCRYEFWGVHMLFYPGFVISLSGPQLCSDAMTTLSQTPNLIKKISSNIMWKGHPAKETNGFWTKVYKKLGTRWCVIIWVSRWRHLTKSNYSILWDPHWQSTHVFYIKTFLVLASKEVSFWIPWDIH